MAQVYKVQMIQTVTAYVKADNEEQVQDWMCSNTPGEVDRSYTVDTEYEDKIICTVDDGEEDIDISTEMED